MKRALYTGIVLAIIGFIMWSKHPLNDTMNFIIGGSIPGTKYAIGFWSFLPVIGLTLYFVHRGIKNLRLQMLENTAKQIKAEQVKSDFESSSNASFDPSQRSVIAARS